MLQSSEKTPEPAESLLWWSLRPCVRRGNAGCRHWWSCSGSAVWCPWVRQAGLETSNLGHLSHLVHTVHWWGNNPHLSAWGSPEIRKILLSLPWGSCGICVWLAAPTPSPSWVLGVSGTAQGVEVALGLELEGGQLRKGIWAHWCQEQELVLIPYLGTKGRSRWALDIEVTWSNLCVTGCNSGIFCVEMSVEIRSQGAVVTKSNLYQLAWAQESSHADTGLWWKKLQYLLQGPSKESR